MINLFTNNDIYDYHIFVSKDYSPQNPQGELLIVERKPAVFTGWSDNYEEMFHRETELIYEAYQRSLIDPSIDIYAEAKKLKYKLGLTDFTLE